MSGLIYMDSKIDWIGKIPSEWELTKLKYISTIVMGQSPASEDCNTNGIGKPFLQGNADFTEKYPIPVNFCENPNKISEKGDILLSVRAPVGAMNIANEEYAIGRGLCAIRSDINMEFLWYSISFSKIELNSKLKGSTFEAVTTEDVKNIKLIIPKSLELQKAIANYLDYHTEKIDTLIKDKERLIRLLEEKRQAMITEAVTKGLDPNVKMKDSGVDWIGEIPEHWEMKKLKYFIRTTKGFAFKSEDFTESGMPVIKTTDIKNNTVINSSNTFIAEDKYNSFEKVRVLKDDILMSTVGSAPHVINSAVGQLGLVPSEFDGALLNQNAVRLEANNKIVLSKYLFYLLCNKRYREYLNIGAHGTANQASLSLEYILGFLTVLPPLEEQDNIINEMNQRTLKVDKLIKGIQEQIQKLKEYRQSLIFEAVTGKIDVRDFQLAK